MPYVKTGTKRLFLPTAATAWEAVDVDGKPSRRPSAGEYWVDMRDRARHGDMRAARQASQVRYLKSMSEMTAEEWPYVIDRDPESDKALIVKTDPHEHNRVLMAQLITGWNLDGEDGPLSIAPESIDLLDERDHDYLFDEMQRRIGRVAGEEGPFGAPSAKPSGESASTIPTSPMPSNAIGSANAGAAVPPS